jgi:hypothetical protein
MSLVGPSRSQQTVRFPTPAAAAPLHTHAIPRTPRKVPARSCRDRLRSVSLKPALDLPVGDAAVVFHLLPAGGVQIVFDHFLAEGFLQHA